MPYSDRQDYNDAKMVNPDSAKSGALMLDKLSRCAPQRRIQPLNMNEYIQYPHRSLTNEYNLRIGDCLFVIPPEFIMVTSESQTEQVVTIRQENTHKEKYGHHKKILLIDLVFSDMDQINGYKVPAPRHRNSSNVDSDVYYVDGLRQLLAQFKCTPFLPVTNVFINITYHIFTVALQSITISTVNNFPNVLKAQLTLQEVEMMPYIDAPNVCFRDMIDWDLFRFYYQSFLTETHKYKRLQSMPEDKRLNHLKISILDADVLKSDKADSTSILDICTDTIIIGENRTTNYTSFLDSDRDDVDIEEFECGYSNILTNIQLSEMSSPTVQYIGGMDTIYNIKFRTKNENVIAQLQQCQTSNDLLTRSHPEIQGSLGFVKLESELVEFTGSLFVMIDSIVTSTVPGFPGLYSVQINCVSYDIVQSEREQLNGFRPFDDVYGTGTGIEQKTVYSGQVITNSTRGIIRKTLQDMYAEDKFLKMELYPDLRLPTYNQVDNYINNVIAFRAANNLKQLEYEKYPRDPICGIHGQNSLRMSTNGHVHHADNEIQSFMDQLGPTKAVLPGDVTFTKPYEGYVDPDFYVFYPLTYEMIYDNSTDKAQLPKARSGYTEEVCIGEYGYSYNYINGIDENNGYVYSNGSDYVCNTGYTGSKCADEFVKALESKIGCAYSNDNRMGPNTFDCSGLVCWGLKQVAAANVSYSTYEFAQVPVDDKTFMTVARFPEGNNITSGALLYEKIKNDPINVRKGDIIITRSDGTGSNTFGHAAVYYDDGKIIHSTGKGVHTLDIKDWSFSSGRRVRVILRPRKFEDEAKASNDVESLTVSDPVDPNNIEATVSEKPEVTNPPTIATFMKDGNGSKYAMGDGSDGRNVSAKKPDGTVLTDSDYSTLPWAWDGVGNLDPNTDHLIILETKEWDYITACIGYCCQENPTAMIPFAQMIYDKYVRGEGLFTQICYKLMKEECPKSSYEGLSGGFDDIFDALLTNYKTKECFTAYNLVFLNGIKVKENTTIHAYTHSGGIAYNSYKMSYNEYGPFDDITFWTSNARSPYWRFVVSGYKEDYLDYPEETIDPENRPEAGSGHEGIQAVYTREQVFGEDYFTVNDIDYAFGEPILVNALYGYGNMSVFNKNTTLQMMSSFNDQYHYSKRCRLVRAFPTYLISFVDDDASWYDGRRLWSNYYTHKSAISIQTHAAYDMPAETATVTITDCSHTLDRTDYGIRSTYNFMKDEEVSALGKWLYQKTGLAFGLIGAKLTSSMIKLNQVISVNKKLREGARVHIRLGYGSDPGSLATVMNGTVTELSVGDIIEMIVTSDGSELVATPVSASQDDNNDGFLGLFGLFSKQEPSNIIADIICKRENTLLSSINSAWYEQSAYAIEHYGIFRGVYVKSHRYIDGLISPEVNIGGEGESASDFRITDELDPSDAGSGEGIGFLAGAGLSAAGYLLLASNPVGWVAAGIALLGGLIGSFLFSDDEDNLDTSASPNDMFNEYMEQFDLTINIYKADYRGYLYTEKEFLNLDGEDNVIFNRFNMTPWDTFQVCTQASPEYIVKSSYFQFDSRLFFGLPFFFERTRYFICNLGGKSTANFYDNLWCEAKPAAQVHFISSTDGIIDNQMRVSSKHTYTNVRVMYLRGEEGATTSLIKSDDTIAPSKQKTKILDSSITQDALGPDWLYSVLKIYDVGHEAAIRTGVSELIYGWEQQYQGQIICTGQPGMKPHDYMLLDDVFSDINGMCLVREVNHSFSVETGFTTSITPGMIAIHSAENNSGMTQYVANYLTLYKMFAEYTLYRAQMYDDYEMYISSFASIYCADDVVSELKAKDEELVTFNTVDTLITTTGVVSTIVGLKASSMAICSLVRSSGGISGAIDITWNVISTNAKNIASAFTNAYKAGKTAKETGVVAKTFAGAGSLFSSIKKFEFITASGNTIKGVGKTAMSLTKGLFKVTKGSLFLLLLSAALGQIHTYLTNKHRIWLVPLWKDEQPFVTNVQNGVKILLFGNQNTDETAQDYEDAVKNGTTEEYYSKDHTDTGA